MTNLKVSTPVIRRVAFSSDTHLTAPKWEGLIICQILQNALSKKSISSPKVTLQAESSFSSNTPWKSFPLLYFTEFWSQLLRLISLFAVTLYLLFLLVFFLFVFLPVCLLSPTAVLSSVTSALLCHLLRRADVSSSLLHLLARPHLLFSPSSHSSSSSSFTRPPCSPLTHLLFFLSPRSGLDWHVTLLCEELSTTELADTHTNCIVIQ